jgi:hypothetical protein
LSAEPAEVQYPSPRSVSDSRAAAGSAFPSPSRSGPFLRPSDGNSASNRSRDSLFVQHFAARHARGRIWNQWERTKGGSDANRVPGEQEGGGRREERGLGASLLRRARNIPDCSWRSWGLRSLIWRWRTEACRTAHGPGQREWGEWRANVKARNRRERLSYATISVLAGARTWFVQLAGCTVCQSRQ